MLSLGKALMLNPRLLLVDEPTLGLAPIVISSISEAFENLKKRGATILIAEQNVSFTLEHAESLTNKIQLSKVYTSRLCVNAGDV
jgi:branched-chain amino acid transport system ATP-binding protein